MNQQGGLLFDLQVKKAILDHLQQIVQLSSHNIREHSPLLRAIEGNATLIRELLECCHIEPRAQRESAKDNVLPFHPKVGVLDDSLRFYSGVSSGGSAEATSSSNQAILQFRETRVATKKLVTELRLQRLEQQHLVEMMRRQSKPAALSTPTQASRNVLLINDGLRRATAGGTCREAFRALVSKEEHLSVLV